MLTIFDKEYVSFYIWFCKEKRAVISCLTALRLVRQETMVHARLPIMLQSSSVLTIVTSCDTYYNIIFGDEGTHIAFCRAFCDL